MFVSDKKNGTVSVVSPGRKMSYRKPWLFFFFVLVLAFPPGAGTEIRNGTARSDLDLLPADKHATCGDPGEPELSADEMPTVDHAAFWPFDEGAGDTAEDAANDNDGTLYGPVWTGGVEGDALSFDGEDDTVEVGHHESLNLTGNLTITVWYRRQDLLDDQYVSIARKTDGVYQLFAADGGNRPFFGDAYGWMRTRERIILPERWTFLAASAEGGSVRFYSNVRADPIYTIGDSITAGHGGPNSHCTSTDNCAFSQGENIRHTYPYWLDQYMGSSASAESVSSSYYNKGHGSQTCDQMYDRFDSDVADGADAILMCGINDFATGADQLEVAQDVQAIHGLAALKNNRLIVMEIIPDGNGLYCDDILAFNAWLDGYASSHDDVSIVRVHDALSSGTPCYYAPALYESDRVHPNEDGLQALALEIWTQVYGERVHGLEEQPVEPHAAWDGIESTSPGSLFLGLREDLTGYPMDGTIDNLMIFDRALTEREVLDLYISQKPGGADCSDPDLDLDGYDRVACNGEDCDDTDHEVNPGAAETCDNGIDDDCDGRTDSLDPDCPPAYPPNAHAAVHGPGSLLGSGLLNPLAAILIPMGAVLLLRAVRRRGRIR